MLRRGPNDQEVSVATLASSLRPFFKCLSSVIAYSSVTLLPCPFR